MAHTPDLEQFNERHSAPAKDEHRRQYENHGRAELDLRRLHDNHVCMHEMTTSYAAGLRGCVPDGQRKGNGASQASKEQHSL